jgi:polyhydroxybutyrate depolymerase
MIDKSSTAPAYAALRRVTEEVAMRHHLPRLTMTCAVTVLFTAVAACSYADNQASADAPGHAAACAGARGSSTTHTMEVGERIRTFIEHVPSGFTAGRKYPAIIAFPGRGESARQLETYSQLDDVGAIVVYAQALPGSGGQTSWEGTPFQGASAHDYAFATALVQWLAGSSCIDASRIDMTGKSDGAGFAVSAACGIIGVAAVATISGAFYQEQNHCAAGGRPLAVLNMHGTGDSVIPYDGNAAEGLYSTDAWIRLWLHRDRCAGPGVSQDIAPGIVQSSWRPCADGTAVINYRIIGGGHTWPGATAPSGPGNTTHAIDAARAMALFFASHPLSARGAP